ncbi:MAG TPA: hypothetical protein VD764_10600 [Nocardioides sp.]|nr:hypothetical protein [Nocardioides sp.]
MTPARPTSINDDHGDQFPGALPARSPRHLSRRPHDRLVRMTAAPRTGRRTPSQHVRPARLSRMDRFTRSLERFDRYTLEVFNAGTPYPPRDDRPA